MMTDEKRKLIEKSFNSSEALHFFGAKLVEYDTDYLSVRVPKQKMMTRTEGMFHGPMISSLVDLSSGYCATTHYDEDCYVVTVELKINFLVPAIGDALLSRSYVVKGGKKISVVRTEIFCVNDKTKEETHVATSLVTMMRIK